MVSKKMKTFLDGLRSLPAKADKGSVQQQRIDADEFMGNQDVPENVLIDDYQLAGRPAKKYFVSDVREDATLLYLHGGGYCVGSLDSHNSFMAHLAVICKTSVNGLAYRLAPEDTYPAALDDALAAYKEMLHYTPGKKIMIAGDSAGGGLALACALRIKEEQLAMPGCLALLAPWTDLSCSGASLGAARDEFIRGAERYAGDQPLDSPGLSPLFGDLSGLPPLLIQVGSEEALRDDSTRLAQRAKEAGVVVDLQIIDDVFHVFQIFTDLPEAQDALAGIGEFYNAHI